MQKNINRYSTISSPKKASDGDGDHGIESTKYSNSSKASNSLANNVSQANSGATKPRRSFRLYCSAKNLPLGPIPIEYSRSLRLASESFAIPIRSVIFFGQYSQLVPYRH